MMIVPSIGRSPHIYPFDWAALHATTLSSYILQKILLQIMAAF